MSKLFSGWHREVDQSSGGTYGDVMSVTIGGNRLYNFDENGRISTSTGAGAVIEFPTGYSRGEAWELRFRSTFTASQFQGIYLQTRSDVANTSGIRGIQVEARQGAAVAIGQLTGVNSKAIISSTSTGNVTTAEGMEVGVEMNGSYTGTVTNFYGLRVLNDIEDGATITTGYSIYVQTRAATGAPTGAARLDAVLGVTTDPANGVGYWRYGIDTSGTEFTNGSGNEVVLWKFIGANGTTYYMVHDTDSATAIGVVTTDPTT